MKSKEGKMRRKSKLKTILIIIVVLIVIGGVACGVGALAVV